MSGGFHDAHMSADKALGFFVGLDVGIFVEATVGLFVGSITGDAVGGLEEMIDGGNDASAEAFSSNT